MGYIALMYRLNVKEMLNEKHGQKSFTNAFKIPQYNFKLNKYLTFLKTKDKMWVGPEARTLIASFLSSNK